MPGPCADRFKIVIPYAGHSVVCEWISIVYKAMNYHVCILPSLRYLNLEVSSLVRDASSSTEDAIKVYP